MPFAGGIVLMAGVHRSHCVWADRCSLIPQQSVSPRVFLQQPRRESGSTVCHRSKFCRQVALSAVSVSSLLNGSQIQLTQDFRHISEQPSSSPQIGAYTADRAVFVAHSCCRLWTVSDLHICGAAVVILPIHRCLQQGTLALRIVDSS